MAIVFGKRSGGRLANVAAIAAANASRSAGVAFDPSGSRASNTA